MAVLPKIPEYLQELAAGHGHRLEVLHECSFKEFRHFCRLNQPCLACPGSSWFILRVHHQDGVSPPSISRFHLRHADFVFRTFERNNYRANPMRRMEAGYRQVIADSLADEQTEAKACNDFIDDGMSGVKRRLVEKVVVDQAPSVGVKHGYDPD